GHQRIRVLVALGRGEGELDVRVPSGTLTPAECEEYLLRSNKNTGSWDYDLLKEYDTSFLLDIGLDEADFAHIWDDVLEIEDDNFKEEDEIEEAKDTDVKDGDLFRLGEHALLCGDSTKSEVVRRLTGEELVDMIYVDIP